MSDGMAMLCLIGLESRPRFRLGALSNQVPCEVEVIYSASASGPPYGALLNRKLSCALFSKAWTLCSVGQELHSIERHIRFSVG